jgi:hypothetical protein
VGAALGQPDDADLRERPALRRARAGPAERGGVVAGVRHVEGDPVDGHQPPAAQPGADRGRGRERGRGLLEQPPQRRFAEPLPRLAQRRRGRHPPATFPRGDEPQPADHFLHDFLVGFAEEQRERDDVIDHQPRRQQSGTFLLAASFGDHFIDQVPPVHSGDNAETQMIR